jgi:hypothetical protein
MTILILAGVASSLALLAIIVKARAGKPKKAQKWEKAQIVKQLLALSEGEDVVKGTSHQQSVPQNVTPRRQAAAASASQSRTARPA